MCLLCVKDEKDTEKRSTGRHSGHDCGIGAHSEHKKIARQRRKKCEKRIQRSHAVSKKKTSKVPCEDRGVYFWRPQRRHARFTIGVEQEKRETATAKQQKEKSGACLCIIGPTDLQERRFLGKRHRSIRFKGGYPEQAENTGITVNMQHTQGHGDTRRKGLASRLPQNILPRARN